MKKITSIICVILMCAMLFAGCTNKAAPSPSPLISPAPSAGVSESPDVGETDDPLENDDAPAESEKVPGESGNVPEESPGASPAA